MRKTSVLKTRGPILAAIAVMTVAILPAIASPAEVSDTRPAAADGSIEIEIVAGSVHVIGWNRAEMSLTGTVGGVAEDLKIESTGRRISISLDPEDGGRHGRGHTGDLEIKVPAGSSVEIDAVSANITVESVGGALSLETVSGKVAVSGETLEVEASSVSGGITVAAGKTLRRGEFETVSGDIELRAALASGGEYSFESVSGGIVLHLPASTSARFDVETFSGDVQNDFGPAASKSSEYLPSKELSFTTGSGDAKVSAESFSGRIVLSRE